MLVDDLLRADTSTVLNRGYVAVGKWACGDDDDAASQFLLAYIAPGTQSCLCYTPDARIHAGI